MLEDQLIAVRYWYYSCSCLLKTTSRPAFWQTSTFRGWAREIVQYLYFVLTGSAFFSDSHNHKEEKYVMHKSRFLNEWLLMQFAFLSVEQIFFICLDAFILTRFILQKSWYMACWHVFSRRLLCEAGRKIFSINKQE